VKTYFSLRNVVVSAKLRDGNGHVVKSLRAMNVSASRSDVGLKYDFQNSLIRHDKRAVQ
jgi:hypothetical protein